MNKKMNRINTPHISRCLFWHYSFRMVEINFFKTDYTSLTFYILKLVIKV